MLEVCVDSFESVENALGGGAHRIELCSALSEGGLTPTIGLLKLVKQQFPESKVFAMLRPHCRISFQMSDTDMETILTDMKIFQGYGVDGFVFGALTVMRDIDIERCEQVIKNADGLPVTFHRAFDMTVPAMRFETIEKIASLGFQRILSSGFAGTAEIGLIYLTEMQQYILDKNLNLSLMPGCGVTVNNAETILRTTGCKEFHASAKVQIIENIPKIVTDTDAILKEIEQNSYSITDRKIVEQLVAIGKMYHS